MNKFYNNWFYSKTKKITLAIFTFLALASSSFAQIDVTLGTTMTQSGFGSSPVNAYVGAGMNTNTSRKIQIVYSASEIAAAGGGAGNITKLAWDVSEVYQGDAAFTNYTIKMGHIATTGIPTSTFITGLTTVVNPFPYTPSTGFNYITFDNVFNWNGTDNILVEICFNNTPYDINFDTHGQSWSYTGVTDCYRDSEAGDDDACDDLSATNSSADKPRVRLEMQPSTTCNLPTAFNNYNTLATSTVLSWTNPTAGSTPSSYRVEVRTSGAAGSGATGLVSSFTIMHPTNISSITGLTASTNYSAYVGTNCGSGVATYTSALNFSTSGACSTPTALGVYNVQATSVVVSWTHPGTNIPASYQIEIRTSGAAGSGATGYVTSLSITHPTNIATITGLTATTSYSAYVRGNCGGSGFSLYTSPATYTTPCTASNIPYSQNIDGVTIPTLPTCFSRQDVAGVNTWVSANAPTSYTGKTLQINTNTGSTNDWFYTLGFNLVAGQSYRIKYKYGAGGQFLATEKMRVCVGSNAINTSMLTTISNHSNIVSRVNSGKADYTAPSTGVYYFGFNAYSDAFSDLLFLDDISLDVKPICSEVTGANITNITTTSSTLNWTVATANTPPGTPANYLLELRTSGAAGSGATGLVSTFTTLANESFLDFTSLTPSTSYTAYVITDCSDGDFSNWTAAVGFTTLCNPGALSNLLASNITNSTAKASFVSTGGAPTSYEIELRTSGAAGSGATGFVSSLTLTHPTSFTNLTSLISDTEYTFYVRSICASGNLTGWESYTFKTLCDAVNVPYTENFNGAVLPNNLPACTSQTNLSASASEWLVFETTSLPLNNLPTPMLNYTYDGTIAANNWFFTRGVNLTAGTLYQVSYRYLGGSSPNTITMDVKYGNSPSSTSMTNTLGGFTSIAAANCFNGNLGATGTVASYTFTPATTGVYYVGFQMKSAANGNYILIDDISVNTAPLNSNSSLSNLSSSPAGTLAPAFSASTFNYTVTLPFGTTGGATLIPTTAEGTSTTSITSATNVAGTAPANVANVVVTAQNGATSTYTVTFNLGTANTNSSLATLTTSVGTLSPTFSAGTFNYTVTLPYGTTGGATLTATTAAGTSTRVITNATDVTGTAPSNVATVVVTAQNGSTSTYTVTYNITPVSTDATLMSLTPSTGTLMPAFSPSITSYTVNIPTGSSGFADLTGVVNSSFASITSNLGALEISSSDPIDNTASITVTAQDGSTLTYYVSFIINVGINENVANSLSASIYPNPTNGLTTLKVNNTNSSTIKVSVVSISGKVVSEKEIKTNNQETNYEINLSNQPKGVYFVKIKTNETTLVKRVITY